MANGQGSAGVEIREYDITGPVGVAPPSGVPAGVIGTALRGPAFVPVTVGSNNAFRLKFGRTDGKKFGPLAINEWMVNSGGGAATYLRVLGAGKCLQREVDGTVDGAGFVVGSQLPSGTSGVLDDNPFATGSNPGRTYFLGGLMDDSTGSDFLSSAGLFPAWELVGSSNDSGVWCRYGLAGNDTDPLGNSGGVAFDTSKVYELYRTTFKYKSSRHADELDGLLADDGDTIIAVKAVIPTGSWSPLHQPLIKFDLGTNTSGTDFSPGAINVSGKATANGNGSASANGNREKNLLVRFNSVTTAKVVHYTSTAPNLETVDFNTADTAVKSEITTSAVSVTFIAWINVTQFKNNILGQTWISSEPAAADFANFNETTKCIFAPNDLGAADPNKLSETYLTINTVNQVAIPIVRAILMAPSGVNLQIKSGSSTFGSVSTDISSQSFVLKLDGFSGGSQFVTSSFNPIDDSYFAKVFNSDPLKIQERGHYLYAHWDVHPTLSAITDTAFVFTGSLGRLGDPTEDLPNFEDFSDRFTHAVSPWVTSQKFGVTTYDLFRFHSLDDGEGPSTGYKFSIENIIPGVENVADGYGSFDLLIRDWTDTDGSMIILESFKGLSLDPRSDRYVARVIGNSYRYFDFDRDAAEQRLVDEIDHPVGSNLVRVEMSTDVESMNSPKTSLPMGFRGLSHLNTKDTLAAGTYAPSVATPPVPMRLNVKTGTGPRETVNSRLFWGVQFNHVDDLAETNKSSLVDESIKSFAKFFPSHRMADDGSEVANFLVTSSTDSYCENAFSLEKVFVKTKTGSDGSVIADPAKWKEAKYSRDASTPAASGTPSTTYSALKVADLKNVGNRRYAKFTFIMQGGFNGVNIFNSDTSDMTNKAVTQEVNNESRGQTEGPTVSAYLKAIDIMKNTVNGDLQLLAIPGIRNPSVTQIAADAVQERFDALYIMDVEQKSTLLDSESNPYDVSEDDQDVVDGLRISVTNTVENFGVREMDNSFAAAYFPDVVVSDPTTGGNVTVPPSVVVLGAMALNDRVGHPWFAPAGVTRGALGSTQRAKVSLSKANLDALYDVGINPLTPPMAGQPVTVWGQKTLQASESPLNRVNVRRLLINLRRYVRDVAQSIIFEPNRATTLARFSAAVTPYLQRVQSLAGLERFRVIIDSSTTTQQDVENNTIRGKIYVQPTKTIEYVSLDFEVSNRVNQ